MAADRPPPAIAAAAAELCANVSGYAHTLANEPSLGLYYVVDHIQRCVPELVEVKREQARGEEALRGVDLDAGFDLEDLALATSSGTQEALRNAATHASSAATIAKQLATARRADASSRGPQHPS